MEIDNSFIAANVCALMSMRTSHKKKSVGDVPFILFKKGLTRQYHGQPRSKRPHTDLDGKTSGSKRIQGMSKTSVHVRSKKEKAFKKTDCGCGCKGE